MTFERGWRQRRAAAQSRAERTKNGSNAYRIWASRQREIEVVGRGLTALVEGHGALLEELKAHSNRLAVRVYNANAAGTVLLDDDVILRVKARLAELPALVDAAHAAVEAERAKVKAERAAIVARHEAEDAAQNAVMARETQAEAAARRARDAILLPNMALDADEQAAPAVKKTKRTIN